VHREQSYDVLQYISLHMGMHHSYTCFRWHMTMPSRYKSPAQHCLTYDSAQNCQPVKRVWGIDNSSSRDQHS
jgi:hypothetical protein